MKILVINGSPKKEAGRQFAQSGKIEKDLLDKICSPMIPEEEYVRIVNSSAK